MSDYQFPTFETANNSDITPPRSSDLSGIAIDHFYGKDFHDNLCFYLPQINPNPPRPINTLPISDHLKGLIRCNLSEALYGNAVISE